MTGLISYCEFTLNATGITTEVVYWTLRAFKTFLILILLLQTQSEKQKLAIFP